MALAAAVETASLRLGDFALRGLDLTLERGELLVLLGPNGAGKSVTLELIAGFHRPHCGRVVVAGQDVTTWPPERRGIGLVVQDFGLFPHLSVAGNVAFPHGGDVGPLLARFGIAHLAGRLPDRLSAGEKQRVALARAVAARPRLFLFDEPFSSLDARSRGQLREDLRSFLRAGEIAAIFVTHDPEEACVLADRVAIMRDGAIVQSGPADRVFRHPADAWVAEFVGVETIVAGRIVAAAGEGCEVAVGTARLRSAARIGGGEVLVCIRAEEVALRRAGEAAAGLPGRVAAVANLGAVARVRLDCGFPLTALLTSREARALGLSPGAAVVAAIAPQSVHLLPPAAGGSPPHGFGTSSASGIPSWMRR